MRFLFLVLLLVIIPSIYAQEVIGPSKEGVTIEAVKNQIIYLGVVESTGIRIGNPREDSIEKYKITVNNIKTESVILKYKKTKNVTVELGGEIKIDFDGDNIFDVGVLLANIRPNKATLTFKSFEDKILKLQHSTWAPLTENKTIEIPQETPNEEVSENNTKEFELGLGENLRQDYTIWIVVALISILIILLIVYFVVKK